MTDSLRILQLAEDFYPKTSGGAFEDWNFAKLSAERGHHVSIYTPQTSETPEQETVHNVEINRPYRATPMNKHPNSMIGVLCRLVLILLLSVRLVYKIHCINYDVIYSTHLLCRRLWNPPRDRAFKIEIGRYLFHATDDP